MGSMACSCSPRGRKESGRTERLTGTGTQTRRPTGLHAHGGPQSRDAAAALPGGRGPCFTEEEAGGVDCADLCKFVSEQDSCPGQLGSRPWRVCWGHFLGREGLLDEGLSQRGQGLKQANCDTRRLENISEAKATFFEKTHKIDKYW